MHILHIINQLKIGGGAEAALYRLVCADQSNTHTVVSLRGFGEYGEALKQQGYAVTALNMRPNRVSVHSIRVLWQLVRKTKPDVVQTWMYHADFFGGVIARLAGCRNVVWGIRHTILDPVGSSKSVRVIARLCANLSRRLPARIVCASKSAAQVHADMGYDESKMRVCFNGYDFDKIVPKSDQSALWRAEHGVDENAIVFGVVARWDPQKDYPTLIEALAQFDKSCVESCDESWVCLMAGREINEGNKTLVDLIARYELQERVKLLGIRNDIPELMNAVDLLLLTSYAEAFPNVLAEAMACGTPCISTNVGDAAHIIGDTGWVVDAGQTEQIAAAIGEALLALRDSDWSIRCDQCRERVTENFSITNMTAAFNRVWAEVKNIS